MKAAWSLIITSKFHHPVNHNSLITKHKQSNPYLISQYWCLSLIY